MSITESVKETILKFSEVLYDKFIDTEGVDDENVLISPFSLYTAFMMTAVGARETTKQEILDCLHIPQELSEGNLHELVGPLLQSYFRESPDVEQSLANRLFLIKDYELKESFLTTLQKHYNADAECLHQLHDTEDKCARINNWISEKTKGKIPALLSPQNINSNLALMLINALYFRGSWKERFDKSLTRLRDFHLPNGSNIKVQMMEMDDTIPYARLPEFDARAVRLPFKDLKWEMLIVLPNNSEDLKTFNTAIRQRGKLTAILKSRFDRKKVRLQLPRFKLAPPAAYDMTNTLTACGMKHVFNDLADFSELCSSNALFPSSVLHKAVMEVDEEGATAAAVTCQYMIDGVMDHPKFIVDRPFFVALICDKTIPMFLGQVISPESS